ncbi:MAG TPA: rhodanese-like domain-containing protein [Microscillaceae bacterium]|nr:rhodanese-like domain-containing protein [Microscillaceae bacterium]
MLGKLLKIFGGGGAAYASISASELQETLKKDRKAQLIDVRSPGEFQSGHISKAKNINVMAPGFKSQIEALDKTKTYYVYCRSGMRSARACKIMAKSGFENVHNLKGGVMAWSGKLV